VSRRIAQSSGTSKSLSFGQWLSVDAQPELYGEAYGAVLLGQGCYDQYSYRVIDPAGRAPAGIEGQDLVIFVPVGGTTTLMSTPRYNQLAEFRGDLPVIEIATKLGNISSYPRTPETLDGRPVAAEDWVMDKSMTFGVSDVAEIGWSMSVGESVGNSESSKISLSGKASVKVAGVKIAGTAGVGQEVSRSLTLSESSMVRGKTPPIPDDPSTPEDEYSAHAFSFTPVLYQHRYQTNSGEQAAFFALTYAVGSADR
ncbi:MAG: hypothetical protein KJO07_17715, partial [Deltaproteobacteria bacterium]|nr:hypothetical protein [Deltaproteobacteria bacterium]